MTYQLTSSEEAVTHRAIEKYASSDLRDALESEDLTEEGIREVRQALRKFEKQDANVGEDKIAYDARFRLQFA